MRFGPVFRSLRASALAAVCLGLACAPRDRTASDIIGESSNRPGARNAATSNAAVAPGASADESLEQRAARLHRQAIIVDGHNDIPSVMLATGTDIAHGSKWTHTDLARMKSGG